MQILTVDIGTGTQDIFLYDSRLDIENGYKLVLPSPTMMVYRRIKEATRARTPIVLTGHQMGGGPPAWAAEAHARAGLPIYATEDAARTLNDELDKVEAAGIKVISDDEAASLSSTVRRLELKDFDFDAIADAFARFGVSLWDLAAVAVAVFDHGAAPPGVSDRQFRFDYLDRRIRERDSLSAFAYLSEDVPHILSRLQSVADSAPRLDCPLVIMDTAPAAVLGATFDPVISQRPRKLIANVGNFHTLAFRLGGKGKAQGMGIEGVFEHHTGEIDLPKLETLLRALSDGTLKHADVFNDMGHGALIYSDEPFELGTGEFDVIVTGPRRSMFNQKSSISRSIAEHSRREHPKVINRKSKIVNRKSLRPYFAVPFGDMMIAGCFGLLAATADVLPELGETIHASMQGQGGRGTAPWDV